MAEWYTAKTKTGTSIASVLAHNDRHAKVRLAEELTRSGRGKYYQQWKEAGFLFERQPGNEATQTEIEGVVDVEPAYDFSNLNDQDLMDIFILTAQTGLLQDRNYLNAARQEIARRNRHT